MDSKRVSSRKNKAKLHLVWVCLLVVAALAAVALAVVAVFYPELLSFLAPRAAGAFFAGVPLVPALLLLF